MESQNRYAPPRASTDVWEGSRASVPDGVRTFGILLVVRGGWGVLNWIVQAFWDFWPVWMAVVELTLITALGVGLIRIGRKLIVPTLALLSISGILRLVRFSSNATQASSLLLVGPFLGVALELLPALLLLIGSPGRARFRAALVVFSVTQLFVSAAWVMRVVYTT